MGLNGISQKALCIMRVGDKMEGQTAVDTALIIGGVILLIWFAIMRPLGAITELPDILNKFVEELKLLNVHLNNIAHQMSAIYIELRRIEEDGISLRRREKPTDTLPFLKQPEPKTDDKEKSAFE